MREFVSNHLAVVLTLGAVILGGAYFHQVTSEKQRSRDFAERAACQSEYNKAFATQLTERSRLSTASDDAKTDLLKGVSKLILTTPAKTEKEREKRAEEFRALFGKFDKAVAKVEKDRAATPLPTIPNC